ncbi:MAG: hypothetical protein ACLPHI_04625 [Terriglobales bacterium]
MTLEFSLRRRAQFARYMAALWLTFATLILVGTYVSLPIAANRALGTIHAMELESSAQKSAAASPSPDTKSPHIEFYAIGVLSLSLLAICFACFLLGRAAFVEIELSARFAAFADALCVAGDNFERLEKATNLMLPGTKYLSVPEIFSTKDLDSLVEVIKAVKSK